MRKKIVAGNWKMNTTVEEGVALASELNRLVAEKANPEVGIVIAPPFTHLSEVAKVIDCERIGLSSQNCSYEPKGAYTGEVSVSMLQSIGCKYVIVGHSERRMYFMENNQTLHKKVHLLLNSNITPIYCCGELLNERNAGLLFDVIKSQISEGLFLLSPEEFGKVVIAYEPVWAIGTGVTASPEQAQEMHAYIRGLITEKYGEEVAQNTTLLYGGSCNGANAAQLFSNPDVDGGLIGGASLKAAEFLTIINSF